MAEASIEELAIAAAAATGRRRELTIPALIAAVIVAAIMGAAYPYMVLKLGFGPNVSVVSAFFGFAILSLIARGSYDRFQNNIVQTAGTSGAQTAFMCGVLASFDMLRASKLVVVPPQSDADPGVHLADLRLAAGRAAGGADAPPFHRRREAAVPGRHRRGRDGDGARPAARAPARTTPSGARRGARRSCWAIGLAASGLLMLVRKDVPLVGWIPEGWDPGALTLGAAGASFVVATMGVGRLLQPAQHRLGLPDRPAGEHLDAGRRRAGLDRRPAAADALRRPARPSDPQRRCSTGCMWPGVGMMLAGGADGAGAALAAAAGGDAGAAQRRGRLGRVSARLGGGRRSSCCRSPSAPSSTPSSACRCG